MARRALRACSLPAERVVEIAYSQEGLHDPDHCSLPSVPEFRPPRRQDNPMRRTNDVPKSSIFFNDNEYRRRRNVYNITGDDTR